MIKMMKHSWSTPFPQIGVQECTRCGTTRDTLCIIGIKLHRQLRTYVRPDGIRFTGCAPACDATFKGISRPILNDLAESEEILNNLVKFA
jgi:hypothetical protein